MMNYLFSLIYTPESVADWFALKIIDLNANQQSLLQKPITLSTWSCCFNIRMIGLPE